MVYGAAPSAAIELATAFEPALGHVAGVKYGRVIRVLRAGAEGRHARIDASAGIEIQHQLAVRPNQHAAVTCHQLPGATRCRAQRLERTVELGNSLAKRCQAAANAPQRHSFIEERCQSPHIDQVRKLEDRATVCLRTQKLRALPVTKPPRRHPANARDVTERIPTHRYRVFSTCGSSATPCAHNATSNSSWPPTCPPVSRPG